MKKSLCVGPTDWPSSPVWGRLLAGEKGGCRNQPMVQERCSRKRRDDEKVWGERDCDKSVKGKGWRSEVRERITRPK